ncbi:MAG: hypothetical protein KF730_05435 [Sphingomonas sp.]|uniref:hypothetical protein n=1 Tax=Sphingomonas sp. TaxID=28214 RepID=UPI0025F93EDE|nr:hypothetical protein [Sphingomonas sp.]MBX3564005.1 hypothetical protein [Sphingomonas sp.]
MARLFSKLAVATAALSLAAGPALAQNSASALSLRAHTTAKNKSDITGPPLIAVIGLLAIVGGGIFIAVDDDRPDSP